MGMAFARGALLGVAIYLTYTVVVGVLFTRLLVHDRPPVTPGGTTFSSVVDSPPWFRRDRADGDPAAGHDVVIIIASTVPYGPTVHCTTSSDLVASDTVVTDDVYQTYKDLRCR